ncbi:tetratricopeptide repeat protein [Asticcacaulis solisilvae]|uniref:tetratricopeptide repeat protein n=1 Tax=Asticcacaulis solisilvae TaxID=1217274 RepID=UPI003FD6FAFE
MSSISTTESNASGSGAKITGFVVLTILAVAVCAVALFIGDAPYKSPYPSDWIGWARGDRTWSGVLVVGVIVLLIGIIGTVVRALGALLFGLSRPKARKVPKAPKVRPAVEMAAPSPLDTALSVPAEQPARASLKFDADSLASTGIAAAADAVEIKPAAMVTEIHPEIQSLEPAIFSDNASDSFLSRDMVAGAEARTNFDPEDALSDTHGLHIGQPSAQVIPIRPEVRNPALDATETVESAAPDAIVIQPAAAPMAHDPVEAALLADSPAVAPRDIPQTDINAAVSSAMRFIETPESHVADLTPVEDIPGAELSGFHTLASAEPVDDQAIIREAVQMALSVWPDSTRAIAADELGVRASYLYYDKAPGSRRAFDQIASGDLSAAANTLQSEGDRLAASGQATSAAELWRVIGALNMGRDDPKALAAYEKVSELDPTDANIHVYLARRYQMAGETGKLRPVLARALAIVGDPETRLELLNPYADLSMKAGDTKAAGDAFEELGRLHETRAYLKPDDVSARSAQGIALARGAQAREQQGAFSMAGEMYKKAYRVFSDLSSQMPEHAGLRAMTDNALRDARRFNMA